VGLEKLGERGKKGVDIPFLPRVGANWGAAARQREAIEHAFIVAGKKKTTEGLSLRGEKGRAARVGGGVISARSKFGKS